MSAAVLLTDSLIRAEHVLLSDSTDSTDGTDDSTVSTVRTLAVANMAATAAWWCRQVTGVILGNNSYLK